jgi:hypothetical protein
MNTDKGLPDLHQGMDKGLWLKEETHVIIGCGFEVFQALPPGVGAHCALAVSMQKRTTDERR